MVLAGLLVARVATWRPVLVAYSERWPMSVAGLLLNFVTNHNRRVAYRDLDRASNNVVLAYRDWLGGPLPTTMPSYVTAIASCGRHWPTDGIKWLPCSKWSAPLACSITISQRTAPLLSTGIMPDTSIKNSTGRVGGGMDTCPSSTNLRPEIGLPHQILYICLQCL